MEGKEGFREEKTKNERNMKKKNGGVRTGSQKRKERPNKGEKQGGR